MTLVTVFAMSFVRHRVREATIAPYYSRDSLTVAPQYVPMALFAVLLIAGIGTLVWMSARFIRAKPAQG
jgi:hypothetical protein